MMSSQRRTRRLTIAACAVAGLLVAACGSDDDESSDVVETTAAAATETTAVVEDTAAPETTEVVAPDTTGVAEPTGSPIVIGALLDITGLAAPAPFSEDILNAWADDVNSRGGLGGHPVQIEAVDTKGDSAGAIAQLETLLGKNPQVIFVEATAVEAALAAPLAASGVPVVGTGFTPALWGAEIEAFGLKCSYDEGAPLPCAPPNVFPLTTTFGAVVDMQVVSAVAAGATKVANAVCAEVEACSQAAPVFEATASALGLEVAPLTLVSASAPDYSAECISFIQDGVDLIQLSTGAAVSIKLVNDCLDQGYEGMFGAAAGVAGGELLELDGIKLVGTLNAFPWFADDPAAQEFRDAMEAAGLDELSYTSSGATGQWTALKLVEKAFENAGITADQEVTAADVLAAMYTISDETLGGLTSPVTFTEGEPAAARNCFWPFILDNGEIATVAEGLGYECYPAES